MCLSFYKKGCVHVNGNLEFKNNLKKASLTLNSSKIIYLSLRLKMYTDSNKKHK